MSYDLFDADRFIQVPHNSDESLQTTPAQVQAHVPVGPPSSGDLKVSEKPGAVAVDADADAGQYGCDRKVFVIGVCVLGVLSVVMLSTMGYILFRYLDGFSLHPERAELSDYNVHLICTVSGFIISPVYSILLYRIFPNVNYSTITWIHVTVLMVTSFVALYGMRVSYESHHVYGRFHLYSLHGWLGVGLGAILFFTIISGNWIYLSSTQLPFMVTSHKIVGMASIVVAGSCAVSGVLTRSQHLLRLVANEALPSRIILLNSVGLMIVVFVVVARWLLTDHRFRRRPRPGTEAYEVNATATGLLRYLTTADDTVILPDEPERTWTEIHAALEDQHDPIVAPVGEAMNHPFNASEQRLLLAEKFGT